MAIQLNTGVLIVIVTITSCKIISKCIRFETNDINISTPVQAFLKDGVSGTHQATALGHVGKVGSKDRLEHAWMRLDSQRLDAKVQITFISLAIIELNALVRFATFNF